MSQLIKQELDDWLDQVDYSYLNSSNYTPSEFALSFMNFIKLVNGEEGESNKTPPVHLKMMDKLTEGSDRIVNLCFRGSGKTTIFMEYFTLYLAVFHEIPGFGPVDGMIYVSDSMENGAKSARKNIEFRYERSEFLKKYITKAKFTDAYLEFENIKGEKMGVKLFGATTGLRGTKIFGKRPVLCHVKGTPVLTDMGHHYVEEYYKKGESRFCKGINVWVEGMVHKETVTPEHKYWTASRIRTRKKTYLSGGGTLSETFIDWLEPRWVEAKDIAISKKLGNQQTRDDYICKKVDQTVVPIPPMLFYKNTIDKRDAKGRIISNKAIPMWKADPVMQHDEWWWLYGLYLADGHSTTHKIGFTIADTQRNTVGKKLKEYADKLGYTVTSERQKPGCYQVEICDSVLERMLRDNHLANSVKNIPHWVMQIDPEKQKQLLLGYIAGDGYIDQKHGQVRISSINQDVIYKLGIIAERLGLPYHIRWGRKKEFYSVFPNGQSCLAHKQLELRLSQNVGKVLGIPLNEKESTEVFFKDGWLYRKIRKVENCVEDQEFIPIETPDHTYQTLFGMSHNCILDDLISDEASKSKTVMTLIKDTVYKGVNYALDPTRHKIIFNGTPFNKEDIIIEAVESGAWDVNVWPVCEHFPCTREEFQGAWSDRFTYDYIQDQYQTALKTGKLAAFYQELMLRISSEDERLVQDSEIRWYDRPELLKNKHNFNFYITTDFATSAKETADYSVISVWAYNANKDWFWVDGICEKQTMDKNIDALFKLVQQYHPQAVGVEITGQQGGFIPWLQREMMTRNIWFNFATTKGTPGIRPTTDKLTRFNLVVPWFKAGKIYFPEQMKASNIMGIFMQQIKLCTINGIKGHDDCIDTISMLGYLTPWEPNENTSRIIVPTAGDMYLDEPEIEFLTRDSYIV